MFACTVASVARPGPSGGLDSSRQEDGEGKLEWVIVDSGGEISPFISFRRESESPAGPGQASLAVALA